MNAKSELIHIAAEMLRGTNMPNEDVVDWGFPKSTPNYVIKTTEEVAVRANEQCRLWAIRLKEISDSL